MLPPSPEELDALLRLIDDETPEVRKQVSERLGQCGGDISEWLASRPGSLDTKERELLSGMLRPSRRAALEREWQVPSGGSAALREDWELLESILRDLSDFLHDGIVIRQALPDALDLLALEAEEYGVRTSNELRVFLFESDRLKGNKSRYNDPRNSDLAWSIAEGRSNPLGLCVIFMLVARRMALDVEAVNFPGHFLCRIFEDGYPIVIDCFDRGRLHLQATLLESPDFGKAERALIRQSADPGTVLVRLLNNLELAFEQAKQTNDAELIRKLRSTLE